MRDNQVNLTCSMQVQKDLKLNVLHIIRDLEVTFFFLPTLHRLSSGLCAPTITEATSGCEFSRVAWTQVAGAEMFVAMATAQDGHSYVCSSNDSLWCNFTELPCGKTYNVTVATVDRGCRSEPSAAVQLRTGQECLNGLIGNYARWELASLSHFLPSVSALCPASNLMGQVSCESNTLTLTWDQTLQQGGHYVLRTEQVGSVTPPSLYNTTNTSYMLSSLQCGERYAFSIAAQDSVCLSSFSPPIEISTGRFSPYRMAKRESEERACWVTTSVWLPSQSLVSQPTSASTWIVGQTRPISRGKRLLLRVSTLWR